MARKRKPKVPNENMLARWEKTDIFTLCKRELEEALAIHPVTGSVRIREKDLWLIAALYEFCAERGRLSAFLTAYDQIEQEKILRYRRSME